MTSERAQQLITQHGCRLGTGSESCLVVINEAINFRFTLPLQVLPDISEEVFVSTITTGGPPRGQRQLPGVYQDYKVSWW